MSAERQARALAQAATATLILLLTLTACSSGSSAVHASGTDYTPPRNVAFDQLPGVEAAARRARAVRSGTTVTVQIPPARSGFAARDALVYLPPVWFSASGPHLPVLMLLPGEPGGPTDWTDDGAADVIADKFAGAHGGAAPIIVMADATGKEKADTECVNSDRFGQVETYLTVDVPAYVRSTFRAAIGADALAVAGSSAGGTCSTVLALRNPDVFSTFASFSGYATPTYKNDTVARSVPILFDGSEASYLAHDPLTLLATRSYPSTAAWFQSGTDDQHPWAAAMKLAPAARHAGMESVCLRGIPGGHTWTVWQQSLTDALPWLSNRLGLTPAPDEPAGQCSAG